MVKPERAGKACDRKFEGIERDKKILNLVIMYNIPGERERAKDRSEARETLGTEYAIAVGTALNEYNEKEMKKVLELPTAMERIGKFVADRTKPRLVQLLFSRSLHKHNSCVLPRSKASRTQT